MKNLCLKTYWMNVKTLHFYLRLNTEIVLWLDFWLFMHCAATTYTVFVIRQEFDKRNGKNKTTFVQSLTSNLFLRWRIFSAVVAFKRPSCIKLFLCVFCYSKFIHDSTAIWGRICDFLEILKENWTFSFDYLDTLLLI